MLNQIAPKKDPITYFIIRYNGSTSLPTSINLLLHLFLGFMISSAPLNGNCFSAGVSYVGALGGGARGAAGFFGVCIGYILKFGLNETVLLLSAALFTYSIAFLFQYTSLHRSRLFMPCIVFTVLSLIGAFEQINVSRDNCNILPLWMYEAIFGALATYVYQGFLFTEGAYDYDELRIYSACAILATVLMGVPCISFLYDFSPSATICDFLLMLICYRGNIQIYPISVMFGVAMSCGIPSREGMLSLYLFCAMGGGFINGIRKSSVVLYMLGCFTLHGAYKGFNEQAYGQIAECAAAAVLFLCCSKKTTYRPLNTKEQAAAKLRMHLKRFSSMLNTMFENKVPFVEKSDTESYYTKNAFERALEQVCSHCNHRSECWDHNCVESLDPFSKAESAVHKRGKLTVADLTDDFCRICENTEWLVMAINYELRRLYEQRLTEEREQSVLYSATRAYQYFSDALVCFSDPQYEKTVNRNSDEQYSAEIGVAVQRKRGERVCGDNTRYFKTDEGLLYIILSDGVGSGETARQYSEGIVRLAEEMLSLLREPYLAISLINHWIALGERDDMGCATVDLLEIDLNTGNGCFYKCGAGRSFLLTEHSVSAVDGNNNLIGSLDPDFVILRKHINFSEGMVIIMSSDGAELSKEKLPLMKNILSENSMKSYAKKLLLSGAQDGTDDKTVIALRLRKRI